MASSRCRVASAIPIARARSKRASGTRRRRRYAGCASNRSTRRKRTSIAGKRTGPTRASTARRSARSPRCLPRSSPRSARCRSSRFGITASACGPCIWMGAWRSRPRTTARRRLDRSSRRRAVERPLRAPARSQDRPAPARARARAARLASDRRRRSAATHTAEDRGAARSGHAHRPRREHHLRSHPPA